MQASIVFLVRVQCRRKESSRSLAHLLINFLFTNETLIGYLLSYFLSCLIIIIRTEKKQATDIV